VRQLIAPGWPAVLAAALSALGSGAALLASIFLGLPLPLGLLAALTVAITCTALIARRAAPEVRARIRRSVAAGMAAGLAAVIVYDLAKALLSAVDTSGYDPFEANRAFGVLLLGRGADAFAARALGYTFHLLNGIAFGVAYTVVVAGYRRLSRSRAVLTGVAWGLFLETFQLAIYPGWLDIRLVREFTIFSTSAHVAYGATLGLAARFMLGAASGRSQPTHPDRG
jgi:hypothetical protein